MDLHEDRLPHAWVRHRLFLGKQHRYLAFALGEAIKGILSGTAQ